MHFQVTTLFPDTGIKGQAIRLLFIILHRLLHTHVHTVISANFKLIFNCYLNTNPTHKLSSEFRSINFIFPTERM